MKIELESSNYFSSVKLEWSGSWCFRRIFFFLLESLHLRWMSLQRRHNSQARARGCVAFMFQNLHWWRRSRFSWPKGPKKFEWMKTLRELYMTCTGLCFMLCWILAWVLTQNWTTVPLQSLTTLNFFFQVCCAQGFTWIQDTCKILKSWVTKLWQRNLDLEATNYMQNHTNSIIWACHTHHTQKTQFWKEKKIQNQGWSFSCLLLATSTLPQTQIHYKITITTFLCHGPLSFSYWSTSFASPTTKPVGPCQWTLQASKHVFWGPQTPW